jgi:hypothetical protein
MFAPPGFVPCQEGIDIIGRELFGKDWYTDSVNHRVAFEELRDRIEGGQITVGIFDWSRGQLHTLPPPCFLLRRGDACWLLRRSEMPLPDEQGRFGPAWHFGPRGEVFFRFVKEASPQPRFAPIRFPELVEFMRETAHLTREEQDIEARKRYPGVTRKMLREALKQTPRRSPGRRRN